MKVVVLPPDKTVIVDGKAMVVNAAFPAEVAAAHWNDDHGVITWVDHHRAPTEVKTDSQFRPYYKLWLDAVKQEQNAQAEREAEAARQSAEFEANRPPIQKMFADPACPSHQELLFALVLAVAGKKPAKLSAYATAMIPLATKYGVDIT